MEFNNKPVAAESKTGQTKPKGGTCFNWHTKKVMTTNSNSNWESILLLKVKEMDEPVAINYLKVNWNRRNCCALFELAKFPTVNSFIAVGISHLSFTIPIKNHRVQHNNQYIYYIYHQFSKCQPKRRRKKLEYCFETSEKEKKMYQKREKMCRLQKKNESAHRMKMEI